MSIDLARHQEILGRLHQAGFTISSLAAQLKVAPGTVTIVSQGHRKSHRIQSAIAEILGVTPQELFPERYEQGEENRAHSS